MVNFSRRFQNKPPFFGVRPKAGLTRENEMLLYLIIFAFFLVTIALLHIFFLFFPCIGSRAYMSIEVSN